MRQLLVKPAIFGYERCGDFLADFRIGEGDLLFTGSSVFNAHFAGANLRSEVLLRDKYGKGEPSDEMVEAIFADIRGRHRRIVAVGGGSILDMAKLLALKDIEPVCDLFDRKIPCVRDKGLILVPTTCGTGSEVTNISILELKSRHTKMGLAADELYADSAVLIPGLLAGIPWPVFATSSIDALIHAVESCVSPQATAFTKLFSRQAITSIVNGYLELIRRGKQALQPLLGEFLNAGCYAGIAFGNAGVGAVHAMSYPLGGKYHVIHGEGNYALFLCIFEQYLAIDSGGAMAELVSLLAGLLGCGEKAVFGELAKVLEKIMPRKRLREYGVTRADLDEFTDNVMTRQGRLMRNNFAVLDAKRVMDIYQEVF